MQRWEYCDLYESVGYVYDSDDNLVPARFIHLVDEHQNEKRYMPVDYPGVTGDAEIAEFEFLLTHLGKEGWEAYAACDSRLSNADRQGHGMWRDYFRHLYLKRPL